MLFSAGMMMAGQPAGGGAWSIVGTQAEVVPLDAGAGTHAITLPGTPAQDDVAVLVLGCDDVILASLMVSSGWTAIEPGGGHLCFTKQMGASPDASVTITKNTVRSIAAILRIYRGANSGVHLDATPTVNLNTSNTVTPNPPSITTVTDGCLIIATGFLDDQITTGVTAPSGFGNLEWLFSGDSVNLAATIAISDFEQATLGVIDPGVFTFTANNDVTAATTIALRPA